MHFSFDISIIVTRNVVQYGHYFKSMLSFCDTLYDVFALAILHCLYIFE